VLIVISIADTKIDLAVQYTTELIMRSLESYLGTCIVCISGMKTLTVSLVILSHVRQKIPEFIVLLKANVTQDYIKTLIIMLATVFFLLMDMVRGKTHNATFVISFDLVQPYARKRFIISVAHFNPEKISAICGKEHVKCKNLWVLYYVQRNIFSHHLRI
jgi:hypothetical protein